MKSDVLRMDVNEEQMKQSGLDEVHERTTRPNKHPLVQSCIDTASATIGSISRGFRLTEQEEQEQPSPQPMTPPGIHPPTHPPIIHPSTHIHISNHHPSIHPTTHSSPIHPLTHSTTDPIIYSSIHTAVHPPNHQSIHASIHHPLIHPSIHPQPSIHQFKH